MANQQYTKRQLKIISGEIPMETIDGRDATWLYKKAIENGDAELAEKALGRKEQAKDEARKRNIKRTVKNKALRRKGITCWRQPKTNEYTERHKQIIKGEIPFDTIHTNELISIHQKAHNKRLTSVNCTYNVQTSQSMSNEISYVLDENNPLADGRISSYQHKVNGTLKANTVNAYDDSYKRLSGKIYTVGGKTFTKSISYDKTRVDSVTDSVGGTTQYGYDCLGRIKSINNVDYTYDEYGQLTQEKVLDKTIQYTYNGIGNIASVTKNGVTTTFGYDTNNPDRLISYNGKTIGYDTMGRVSSYDGYTYSWANGKLSGMSCGTFRTGTESYSFGYDANGQRVSKEYFRMLPTSGIMPTYPGMVLNYNKEFVYDNAGRLIVEYISETQQDYGMYSRTLKYLYDETGIIGVVYSVGEGESIYYYLRNILGDVVAIYDTNGNKVVEYTYDAWGNCTIGSGTTNSNLAHDNPIRYRGYYYDEDTNLYCLGARYYSPEWRRFISPDDTAYLDPENVNGLNLYCYCNNDPVNYVDPSGHFSISAILIGAVIGFATSYLSDVIDKTKDGFEWSDFNTFEGNWLKYIGSALGGAIGSLGAGFCSTIFFSGIGNVVEGVFARDVSSVREAITFMISGGFISGIGYGFSKGIIKIFANRKIMSILGNMSENIKVNKLLAQSGFGYLKIGKHGLKNIYEEMYDVLGYDTARTVISYGFDIVTGLVL